MASIITQPNGRKAIQFSLGGGAKRQTVRLGKVSRKAAETVKVRIEHLVSHIITGHPLEDETSRWVARLDDGMADRLAAVGLIPERASATLGPFIDQYSARRKDVKASTATVYSHTRRNLIEFFGADKPLRELTPGDADDWRLSLVDQGLAENTVRR